MSKGGGKREPEGHPKGPFAGSVRGGKKKTVGKRTRKNGGRGGTPSARRSGMATVWYFNWNYTRGEPSGGKMIEGKSQMPLPVASARKKRALGLL